MFAPTTLLLALALVPADVLSSTDVDKCYDHKEDFYPYLSTKTAYHYVHGNITRPETNCTAVQIWMLSRHGTRYPGKDVVALMLSLPTIRDEISENHKRGNGRLCIDDLENLKKWQWDPTINNETADTLVPQGKEDNRLLAKRLKNAFPELLEVDPKSVKPNDYIFQSTDTQRTRESLKSFALSLFGTNKTATFNPTVNDTLLLTHKNCPAWESSNESNRVNKERDAFVAGPEFQSVLKNVSVKLGYTKAIDHDKLKAMYEMCRFETAWYLNKTSVWCTIFNKEELKILEYKEDLDYYYFSGPGRDMSSKLGCKILTDMFKHFKKLEKEHFVNQTKGIFYFAHTITLQSLMAALKIGKDKNPITARTYATAQNRTYRTSINAPFSTNVIAVFYRCNGTKARNKVMFYLAEKLVPMPGCKNGLCNWEYLKREFGPDVDSCSMDFCNAPPRIEITSAAGPCNKAVTFEYLVILVISLVLMKRRHVA